MFVLQILTGVGLLLTCCTFVTPLLILDVKSSRGLQTIYEGMSSMDLRQI